MPAGRRGHEVVPCFWQQGGPLRLASDNTRLYWWGSQHRKAWMVEQGCRAVEVVDGGDGERGDAWPVPSDRSVLEAQVESGRTRRLG